jgi:copper(I)-binding protein
MSRWFVSLIALMLFAVPAAHAQDGGIRIDQPWARATPGAVKSGAVYLTIVNSGATDDQLTVITSPAADRAMVHVMKMDKGVMSMRPVVSLPIPANQSVKLDPSSDYHVMLEGLKAPLKEGQTVSLTLTFAHAGQKEITAPIAKVGAMQPDDTDKMPAGGMGNMPKMGH